MDDCFKDPTRPHTINLKRIELAEEDQESKPLIRAKPSGEVSGLAINHRANNTSSSVAFASEYILMNHYE
jgi:hypothetical protein